MLVIHGLTGRVGERTGSAMKVHNIVGLGFQESIFNAL